MTLSRTLRALVAPVAVTALSTLALCLSTGGALAVTYTYVGPNTGSWQTASNWSPNRTVISATDVLTFPSGSITILNVPDQTVAQVQVPTGAHIRIVSELNGLRTLTIAGATGEDLVVQAGASLGNWLGPRARALLPTAPDAGARGGAARGRGYLAPPHAIEGPRPRT